MNLFTMLYPTRAGGTLLLLFILIILYIMIIHLNQKSLPEDPMNLQKYFITEHLPDETIDVEELKTKVLELNTRREVMNWRRHRAVRSDTPVIVIQVHKDVKRLQHLIVSLAQARHIQTALLIFSHSYYSELMNRLVRSISFCKVMQIFYPYSLQLHPNKFPGFDPEDCVNGSQTVKACQTRDASLTEHKQHWWWKANFIFDRMEWSRIHSGTVIFLEQDHYVAPDLLYMLRYVRRSLSYFPNVEVMSFGTMYVKNLDTSLLTLEYWRPPFDVGIAFNRTTWKKIAALSSFYCMYDDYSWSYSLLNLFKRFPKGNVNMVACVAPRVISTKNFDDFNDELTDLSRLFRSSQMYPRKVNAVFLFGPDGIVERKIKSPPKGNGGWNDIRDQLLCLDPLISTTENYDTVTSTSTKYST